MQNQRFAKKKGIELSGAFNAVLLVSLVAILIVAVIYMFTALQTVAPDVSVSVINETVAMKTSGTAVSNSSNCGFSNFAVTQVYNATSVALSSGNYTTTSAGLIANTTSIYGTNWLVSYSYTDKGATCSAAQTFTTNFSNQIPLVGLVLTIVLIAIVIGVLVSSFFMRQERV